MKDPAIAQNESDARISTYLDTTRRLIGGRFDVHTFVDQPSDEVGALGAALTELAGVLRTQHAEWSASMNLSREMAKGLVLEDVLSQLYDRMHALIPYDRIGVALLEDDAKFLRARWARAEYGRLRLSHGYAQPMAGSSLEMILRTGTPRIINDLEAYLAAKPTSQATALIVGEGVRSSLTCPLVADGKPIGFMFFSSTRRSTYAGAHVEGFQRLAELVSIVVERARLVSAMVARDETITRQNAELQELLKTKNAFLGMAAHDLRNPLSVIRMTAELLVETEASMSEDSRESLRQMQQHVDGMARLLADLLETSRNENAVLEVTPQSIEAERFLREAVRRHDALARVKGTTVRIAALDSGALRADPGRLDQSIDNLVSNAVKFSPPGSTVDVSLVRDAGGWRLLVHDQGPGLREEDRSRLFTQFGRLSATPTAGESSTGLGLAITKRIVEAHGGTIGVDSAPGSGATFWITLPG